MRLIATPGLSFLAAALITFAGCGSGGSGVSVRGAISFNGQPLTAGTVTFVGEKSVATGQISNGEYMIPQAPVGSVKISVITPPPLDNRQMNQRIEGKTMDGQATMVVSVPFHFNNPDSSGLIYTVTKEATQTHNIELQQ